MAFKPTVGYIADAFQGAFRQRLEQAQREREFNQKMNEEQRQSSLLEYWKQKNYEVDKLRAETDNAYKNALIDNMNLPTSEKPVASLLGSYTKNGVMIDKYGYTQDGKEVITNQKFHNIPTSGQDKENNPQWKGFGNYFKDRAELMSGVTTIENEDGSFSNVPLTPGEIQVKIQQLRNNAISSLPTKAQTFYLRKFEGKTASQLAFHNEILRANENGELSDKDAESLIQFNQLRGDWGEIPQGERMSISRNTINQNNPPTSNNPFLGGEQIVNELLNGNNRKIGGLFGRGNNPWKFNTSISESTK